MLPFHSTNLSEWSDRKNRFVVTIHTAKNDLDVGVQVCCSIFPDIWNSTLNKLAQNMQCVPNLKKNTKFISNVLFCSGYVTTRPKWNIKTNVMWPSTYPGKKIDRPTKLFCFPLEGNTTGFRSFLSFGLNLLSRWNHQSSLQKINLIWAKVVK